MSCISTHSRALRARGFRMTPQRLAVLQAMHEGGHHSPLQVFERVRQTGMTETTVYRTLEFLRENGILYCAHGSGGHLVYELAHHSHHHLVCRRCGAQVEIDDALLADFTSLLAGATGYRLVSEHQTFFGLCPACQGEYEKEKR